MEKVLNHKIDMYKKELLKSIIDVVNIPSVKDEPKEDAPFRPSFLGQRGIAHNPNEYMDINDIILNTKIFAQGIYSLAKSI